MSTALTPLALLWRPAAPPTLIAGAAAVLGALALFVWFRTSAGHRVAGTASLLMRLAAVAALGVILMGPSRTPERRDTEVRPTLNVLLDTSASMLTPDCQGQARIRYAIDHWLTPQQLAELSR